MMRPEYWTNSEINLRRTFSSSERQPRLAWKLGVSFRAVESMCDSHLMDSWISDSRAESRVAGAIHQILSTILDATEIPLDPTTHWRQTLNGLLGVLTAGAET